MNAGNATNALSSSDIGIRITPPNLVYTNGQRTRWFGSGILNKPHSDFAPNEYLENPLVSHTTFGKEIGAPFFAERSVNSVRLRIHHRVIPEPGNYILIACMLCVVYVVARSAIAKRK